jgi:hypothetical protein
MFCAASLLSPARWRRERRKRFFLSFEGQATISPVGQIKLPFSPRIPRFISDNKMFFSAISKKKDTTLAAH